MTRAARSGYETVRVSFPPSVRERETAERLIAEAADKPVRRIGPGDYAAGVLQPVRGK